MNPQEQYIISKQWNPITRWCSVISEENRILSYTAAKPSKLAYCSIWV